MARLLLQTKHFRNWDYQGTEMASRQPRSIYKHSDRYFDDNDVRQWSNHRDPDPHEPSGDSVVTPDSSVDWSLARKKNPVNYMLPMTIRWLETLPQEVRPTALVTKYPRIANVFALEWNNPTACRAFFAELLIDHRGTRKGFPADVHRDLITLRDHYGRQGISSG